VFFRDLRFSILGLESLVLVIKVVRPTEPPSWSNCTGGARSNSIAQDLRRLLECLRTDLPLFNFPPMVSATGMSPDMARSGIAGSSSSDNSPKLLSSSKPIWGVDGAPLKGRRLAALTKYLLPNVLVTVAFTPSFPL
jgi:hypothetical protein